MPWWGYVLMVLVIVILPVILYFVYCMTYDSKEKSSRTINAIIRYGFSIFLILTCIFGFGSYFVSCSSEQYGSNYEEGYEEGYEAGIEAGIDRVKDDPSAYFD